MQESVMEQFKTLCDLQELIKEYELILMRPTPQLSHPTLYRRRDAARDDLIIKGVRVKDWFLSEDHKWVKPHDQMGLSFSSTYKNLKSVYKLKERHNASRAINIYWVLEKADIPAGFKFMEDIMKPGHYFLTVTETMLLSTLVTKLKLLSKRMTVIRDGSKVL